MKAPGLTIDSSRYPSPSAAPPLYSGSWIRSEACLAIPASDGPTSVTPDSIEWHVAQAPPPLNSALPRLEASADVATPSTPGNPRLDTPDTRMGRGGQPLVSMCPTQSRNAM